MIQFILPVIILLTGLSAIPSAYATEKNSSESIQEEITKEITRDREQEASEDPLSQRQSDKTDNPALYEIKPNRFTLYGSLRLRYRETQVDSIIGDGGTRLGADGAYQFVPNYWLLGRLESGFKLFDNLDQILDPGGQGEGFLSNDVFLRLAYVGIEFPKAFLTYGKSWSTYYQVASFTDRFQGTGAGASGTFNADTDGGPSGTGRADKVWQTRIQIAHPWGPVAHLKPFSVNLQYQAGEKIPHARESHYKYTFGASAIVERTDNLKTGIAFNYAAVDKNDLPRLRLRGIDGDGVALLVGAQWFGEKWYAATVFSWLDNHMATTNAIYFDAWGSEGYGHYHIFEKIWLVGGWNYLTPRSGETQAGEYILKYAVLGLRYTFKDFQRMIYANIRFDKSHLSSIEDQSIGNTYTIGVRWDFDW